jgi:hypothetical protein
VSPAPQRRLPGRRGAGSPRTELIGLILESLDQVPPEDRFDFARDMHYARDAPHGAPRHRPHGLALRYDRSGHGGVKPTKDAAVMEVIIKDLDELQIDAERLRITENTIVRWLENLGAW